MRATAARLSDLLGEPFVDGGIHPRFGTRNMVLPLCQGTYLEVVEALDHPASDKAPFGQAVKARSGLGGGCGGAFVIAPHLSTSGASCRWSQSISSSEPATNTMASESVPMTSVVQCAPR